MKEYYKDLAQQLFLSGYAPIPIRPKSKIPFMDKGESWQVTIDQAQVDSWRSNGKASGGVGLTGLAAIDFDVKDKSVSNSLIKYMRDNFKNPLIRVGLPPKFLTPLSPSSAITKKQKNTWYDLSGEKQELEFLAPADQYFVAYGLHPDTGKDYKWIKNISPQTVHAKDLLILNDIDLAGIEDEFDRIAESKGWTRDKPVKSKCDLNHLKKPDKNFDLIDYKPAGEANIEELKVYLDKLPARYCDDREEWVRIGAAVHHGTGGSLEGFELFDDWSRRSSLYKGMQDTEARWNSFSIDKHGENAVTVGTIVHILKEEGLFDDIKTVTVTGYKDRIKIVNNEKELRRIMDEVKKDKTIDNLTRSSIALWIRKKANKDLGLNWKLSDIMPLISFEFPDSGELVVETWVEGWYFLSHQNKFGKPRMSEMVMRGAFNGLYSRELVGRPELEAKHQEADKYVLDICRIPCVFDVMYLPGAGDTFDFDGKQMINSYDPDSIGKRKPESEWTKEDRAAVTFFLEHIYEMFPLEGEARLLLDAMAYVVQNIGKRILWALVIYGCEGDGKTTICKVLSRAVGEINAGIVNGADIVNSNFSDWAVGQRFKVAEELKVSGKNRFETVDRIKTFITNDPVSINPKYQIPKKVPNTASIFATTNHRDAIPFLEHSRRFALICSKWESKAQITAKYGKNYFTNLINLLESHEEAMNEYLYIHKISDEFDPYTLPDTPSLAAGIENEKSDLIVAISDLISSGKYASISQNIIVMGELRAKIELLKDEIELEEEPALGELKRALKKMGYMQAKKYTIFGKGTRAWIKGIKDERSEIVKQLEGIKDDPEDIF